MTEENAGATPEDEAARALRAALEKANRRVIRAEVKTEAVRLGAHDAADLLRLVDTDRLTLGEDGEVQGVQALLAEVKAAKPWAFSAPSATGQPPGASTSSTFRPPPPSAAAGKRATEMTAEEYRAARAALTVRR